MTDQIPQRRQLVTAVPGPRSQDLMARKAAAVADGVGTTMPVFADRAGGGVVVDIDGNGFSTECEPPAAKAGQPTRSSDLKCWSEG